MLVSLVTLLGVLGIGRERVDAADPQPYSVTIGETGNSALDKAMADASQLKALREKAPVAPFALISRAQADVGRLESVLQGFGYYDGKVTVTIDGRPVGDSDLPKTLEAVPSDKSVAVKIAPEAGPLYRLGRVTIDGKVPPDARAKLGLSEGQPAVASDVLAAGARLLTAMQEDGYALATVAPPDAVEHLQRHAIDVTFKAEEGRRAQIGAIKLTGLSAVDEDFVRRRLLVHSGQLYQPSKIDAARQDLASLGVFSGVSVSAGTAIAANGGIPLTYAFEERPPRTVGVTGAYSTDLGGSLTTTWSHRNLFGNAEQLNLSAAATGLGGTATKGLGYDASAQFLKPDFLQRDQTLEFNAVALKQDLQAYNQRAETLGGAVRRKLSDEWSVSLGLTAEQETIAQEGLTRDYTLLAVPFTARYDSTGLTNPLTDPTHGIRATLTATPTESFGRIASTFAILQAAGSAYVDLGHYWFGTEGRSVLALRALVGSVQGAGQFDLPPDQRFYGGGSATVRGFKYQSIGPLFSDDNPIGGTSIDAGTIEFRQRLFGDFGFAAFADAGQVSASSAPFGGTMRIGAGVGLRYYTPIGPVRLDVAVPLNTPPGGDRFELYLGLGQAF
ncbi:MAG TPA: autotransporter assembly complex family protein [Stellaceae bacterium]